MSRDLLLLHGAIGSSGQLKPLQRELGNDFTVHLLNFSGHGGKTIPGEFSISAFAEDVLRYLEEKKINSIDIFGYSMGGYVALYLAKHYPGKVNRIFTLATKFSWSEDIAEREIKMLDAEKIIEKIPAFAQVLKERHSPADWKTVLQKTADMMQKMGKENPLSGKDFKEITNEVMVSAGDRDTMVSMEETMVVYRFLQNGKLLVIPDTQHPIEKVNTQRLAYEIRQFFKP